MEKVHNIEAQKLDSSSQSDYTRNIIDKERKDTMDFEIANEADIEEEVGESISILTTKNCCTPITELPGPQPFIHRERLGNIRAREKIRNPKVEITPENIT